MPVVGFIDGGSADASARRRAWLRSDVILLDRIVLDLVSNAVRYTSPGGIVVGCRRCGDSP